jgi:hypothetical protein
MPETGKVYGQVSTPGEKLILQARNVLYLYTASAKEYRYGGPLLTWAHSMLFMQRIENDPNLNYDLYQCSLLGTNTIRLASAVTDYYPQAEGCVIFKRRTSRSGHDLLLVKSDEPGKEKLLYRAMDFGDAAMSRDQYQWAGYVRPSLETGWTIVAGQAKQDTSKTRMLSLPTGVSPGKIAWSGDTIIILTTRDGRKVAFETNTTDNSPVWKPVNIHSFPGQDSFILSKSESLVVEQVNKNGKPVVEVARVWFTGDRNVVAEIRDFNMKGCDLIGSYVFIWGDKGTVSAAYTVDIRTGDLLVSLPGAVSNIKPFDYPPYNSPIPRAQKME